jgi:hypothetical protein
VFIVCSFCDAENEAFLDVNAGAASSDHSHRRGKAELELFGYAGGLKG